MRRLPARFEEFVTGRGPGLLRFATWQQVWPPPGSATTGTPEAFSSQDALTAEVTVAVSAPTGTYLVVYRTHDGGRAWQPSVVALPAR